MGKKKLTLQDLASLQAEENVTDTAPQQSNELIDGQKVWVIEWYPTNTPEPEVVETEKPSGEFPYGRFVKRKFYKKALGAGTLSKRSLNNPVYGKQVYWRVCYKNTEYSYSNHRQFSGTTEFFLVKHEAEERLAKLPDYVDSWVEKEEPRRNDYSNNNYGPGNSWSDKGYF